MYLNPKQQILRALYPFDSLCHNVGQNHQSKLYTVPISDGWALVDKCRCSECSGKPCYNVSCDMPGSCKSLVYTHCGNNLRIYSLTGTMWANTIYELADPYNATIEVCVNTTQVKGVFRTNFRWTSPSLISAGTTNTLENNVACDMPGQIPYMSWLILVMPLSMSMCNCAIRSGKRRTGELFYNNRSAEC